MRLARNSVFITISISFNKYLKAGNVNVCLHVTSNAAGKYVLFFFSVKSVLRKAAIPRQKIRSGVTVFQFTLKYEVSRQSQSNVRKLNTIEPNQTQSTNWVSLNSAIEPNRIPNVVWVRFPNQSNSIEQIEPDRTQSISLCPILVWQPNSIERNPMDCARLTWVGWVDSL